MSAERKLLPQELVKSRQGGVERLPLGRGIEPGEPHKARCGKRRRRDCGDKGEGLYRHFPLPCGAACSRQAREFSRNTDRGVSSEAGFEEQRANMW